MRTCLSARSIVAALTLLLALAAAPVHAQSVSPAGSASPILAVEEGGEDDHRSEDSQGSGDEQSSDPWGLLIIGSAIVLIAAGIAGRSLARRDR